MRAVSVTLSWVLLALVLTGCGGMIQSLRQESQEADADADREKEEIYVAPRPKILKGLSANNVNNFDPPVQRQYGQKLSGVVAEMGGSAESGFREAKRMTRADFIDREVRENSLWDAKGQGNYLFANNKKRESGDLIVADVDRELRREIQYQLWMGLPPEMRKIRKPSSMASSDAIKNVSSSQNPADAASKAREVAKSTDDRAKDSAEEAAKTNMAPTGKDDDIVRMEIVETLGNGLVRAVGQKRVIYRGASKIIEVSALMNSKDIDDNGHTKSASFLDARVQVIQ